MEALFKYTCFTLANINQKFLITLTEKLMAKWKMKDILFNKKVIRHKMRRIQSKKHKIEIYEVNKIPLSRFDDERYILNDSIHTLACFHKDLKNQIFYRKQNAFKDSD